MYLDEEGEVDGQTVGQVEWSSKSADGVVAFIRHEDPPTAGQFRIRRRSVAHVVGGAVNADGQFVEIGRRQVEHELSGRVRTQFARHSGPEYVFVLVAEKGRKGLAVGRRCSVQSPSKDEHGPRRLAFHPFVRIRVARCGQGQVASGPDVENGDGHLVRVHDSHRWLAEFLERLHLIFVGHLIKGFAVALPQRSAAVLAGVEEAEELFENGRTGVVDDDSRCPRFCHVAGQHGGEYGAPGCYHHFVSRKNASVHSKVNVRIDARLGRLPQLIRLIRIAQSE